MASCFSICISGAQVRTVVLSLSSRWRPRSVLEWGVCNVRSSVRRSSRSLTSSCFSWRSSARRASARRATSSAGLCRGSEALRLSRWLSPRTRAGLQAAARAGDAALEARLGSGDAAEAVAGARFGDGAGAFSDARHGVGTGSRDRRGRREPGVAGGGLVGENGARLPLPCGAASERLPAHGAASDVRRSSGDAAMAINTTRARVKSRAMGYRQTELRARGRGC